MHFVTKLQPGKLRYKIFGVLQPGKVEVQKYLGCHSRGKLGTKIFGVAACSAFVSSVRSCSHKTDP